MTWIGATVTAFFRPSPDAVKAVERQRQRGIGATRPSRRELPRMRAEGHLAVLDPAMLQVLAHIDRPSLAIIEPAPGLDGGPFAHAYASLMREQEREFENWLAAEPEAKADLVDAIRDRPQDFTPDVMAAMIEPFERRVRREMRRAQRLRRSSRRHPLRDPLRRRGQDWPFDLRRRHAEVAEDLILFLRAARADPEGRGGPTFDDAENLERYLLTAVA